MAIAFCPRCQAPLTTKQGPYGEFQACSRYPRCRYTQRDAGDIPCPRCSDGKVIEKRTKQGRAFYACHLYPACDFTAPQRPIAEKCPQCSSPYLLAKERVAQCPNKECNWRRPQLGLAQDA